MIFNHFLLTDEKKCLKDSKSDWESEVNSELKADSKLEPNNSKLKLDDFKSLMFTKINFTLKSSAWLSSLMSTAASQTNKVSIANSAAVVQEVWKQMLNQKQSNKF